VPDAVIMLPRLGASAVERLLNVPPPVGGDVLDNLPDEITYGAVGGARLSTIELRTLRDGVESVARACGYPESNTAAARSAFDAACAAHLAQLAVLRSGEAHRADVWAFISACLLRDITIWRFGMSPSRHHGGIRNTFQRLWIRGTTLDRGKDHPERWGLVDALTEDAFVALLERPGVSADRRLALAIAEGWVASSAKNGQAAMEPIMRAAIVRARVRNEIVALADLAPSQLAATIHSVFADAEAAVRAARVA
jgi:hypothetical protein